MTWTKEVTQTEHPAMGVHRTRFNPHIEQRCTVPFSRDLLTLLRRLHHLESVRADMKGADAVYEAARKNLKARMDDPQGSDADLGRAYREHAELAHPFHTGSYATDPWWKLIHEIEVTKNTLQENLLLLAMEATKP